MKNNKFNIKGIKDINPKDIYMWKYIEKNMQKIASTYGYQEIRLPIIEKTDLFEKTLGSLSDIITKETFSFIDKDNSNLTLRPEGTAGCMKILMKSDLIRHKQKNKYWYCENMFRRENPQKGRYRQFKQFGIEAIGFEDFYIDIEQIIIIKKIFKKFKINNVKLNINCIGKPEERKTYIEELKKFLEKNVSNLNNLNKERMLSNPLRILDDKSFKNLQIKTPKIINYLNDKTLKKFYELLDILNKQNIKFELNTHLVRGLDYYNDVVYEWTKKIGNDELAICAGGRYDSLSETLGGQKTFATGCALGIERLMLFKNNYTNKKTIDAYILFKNNLTLDKKTTISEKIRKELPKLKIITDYENITNIETKIKKIYKKIENFIFIIEENEIKNNNLRVKILKQKSTNIINIAEIKNLII